MDIKYLTLTVFHFFQDVIQTGGQKGEIMIIMIVVMMMMMVTYSDMGCSCALKNQFMSVILVKKQAKRRNYSINDDNDPVFTI